MVIWPWSRFREYEAAADTAEQAYDVAIQDARRVRDELKIRCAVTETKVQMLEAANAALRDELSLSRDDTRRAVEKLGDIAKTPIQKYLFDEDPHAEKKAFPDEWVSPGPEDTVPIEAVEKAIDEASAA